MQSAKRISGLDMAHIVRSMVVYSVAAVPAVILGAGLVWLLGGYSGGWALNSVLGALVTMALTAVLMSAVYVGALILMRSPELREALAPVTRRLRRR